MNKLLLFGLGSVLGAVAGYVLINSYEVGLCYANLEANTFDVSCHQLAIRIGAPLFYGLSALATIFIVLHFFSVAVEPWKKFAKWFIPIAVLILVFWSDEGGGFFSITPSIEQVSKFLSSFYILISLFIIGRSVFKDRASKS